MLRDRWILVYVVYFPYENLSIFFRRHSLQGVTTKDSLCYQKGEPVCFELNSLFQVLWMLLGTFQFNIFFRTTYYIFISPLLLSLGTPQGKYCILILCLRMLRIFIPLEIWWKLHSSKQWPVLTHELRVFLWNSAVPLRNWCCGDKL